MTLRTSIANSATTAIEDFWSPFVEQNWEKASCMIREVATTPLPSLDIKLVFQAAVRACAAIRDNNTQILRLYIGELAVDPRDPKFFELLPCEKDGDFLTYHHRVSKVLDEPYGLIVTDWHKYCRSSWETICASLRGLTDQVGVSASRMDTQLFLGTYERTAFGVHVDDASGFHFPLIGKKKLRFWPNDYVISEPSLKHSHSYDNFLDASHCIEAEPGEMIYWPSHYWHIGEGDGNFNLTWRFGYWIADGLFRRAMTEFSNMPADGSVAHRFALPLQATGEQLKAFAWNVIHDLQSRAEGTEFRDRIIAATLELQSAFGFTRVPQPEIPEDRTGPFGLKFPFRIEHGTVTPDKRVIAVAGKSCRLLDSPRLKQLIDALNAGAFIEAPNPDSTGESVDIHRFLEFMQFSGGVRWERAQVT